MASAISLGERGVGRTGRNPSVGCVVVNDGRVVGRGYTQPGGRPHAEAEALAQAGDAANGSTIYVTLEPCAHESDRGPACLDLLLAAKPSRVVIACQDPDRRTAGKSVEALREVAIAVDCGVGADGARRSMAGYFSRQQKGRPQVTVKLATSLDGCIALASGESQWITGEAARAHTHLERARHDAILIGGGTLRADEPSLDVRLPGFGNRSPERFVLTSGKVPDGWRALSAPEDIAALPVNRVMVEGGAQTAAAFLRAGLVDRLLLYRAPIVIGSGKPCLGDIGLDALSDAHGRWQLIDGRQLGADRMELYEASGAA